MNYGNMKRTMTFILLIVTSALTLAQSNRFMYQINTDINRTYHHGCTLEDKSIHRGCSGGCSFKASYHYKRVYFLGGIGTSNLIADWSLFSPSLNIPLTCQVELVRIKRKQDFSLYLESGYNLRPASMTWSIPFEIGVRHYFSNNLNLMASFKVPTLTILTDEIGTFPFVEHGINLGVAFRPKSKKQDRIIPVPCMVY